MTQTKHKNIVSNISPPRMSGEMRRHQLIEAGLKLFSRKGFSGITIKDIATLTEMSEANIFRHFASKDALYAAVIEKKINEVKSLDMLGRLHEIAEKGSDREILSAVIKTVIEHFRSNREFWRMVIFGTLEGNFQAMQFSKEQMKPLRDFLAQYITERQKDNVFRPCNTRTAVSAILAMPSQYALINSLLEIGEYEVSDNEAIETFTHLALSALTFSNPVDQKNEVENKNV